MDYYIYKDGQNIGPLPENAVIEGIRNGRFLPQDLSCRVGEQKWVNLDILFPNVSNQAHSWMEQNNAPQQRSYDQPQQPFGVPNQGQQQWQQSPQPQPMRQQVFYQQPAYVVQPVFIGANKSRVTFILLGLFLGGLGVHNFYGGYSGRGIAQLLLSLFLFWTIIVPIIVGLWVIIEVITVDRDAYGNMFI